MGPLPGADPGGRHPSEGPQGRSGRRPEAARPDIKAWCLYNWADHAWATPVAAVLIGPWMLALADNAVGHHGTLIALGALRLKAEALPSAMITVAALVQLVLLPGLGATVDARDAKRRGLGLACAAGSVICGLLAFTGGSEWLLVSVLFVAGSLIEGVSDLAWNGMLPELAAPGDRDHVSSRGTAVGYLGGGLLLIVDLLAVDLHSTLGLSKGDAVRACFALAGAWWAYFGWRAIRRLHPVSRHRPAGTPVTATAALRATFHMMRAMPQARRYVIAYLFFADAISAVISLAATFLTHQLFNDNTTKATPFLFELILVIQFVALLGAIGFSRIAGRWGAKPALVVTLVIWSALIIYCYALLETQADAWFAGAGIGVVLGASTALARSLFSQMIPAGAEATWFGIYEVCSQGTAWVAPLLFTIVVDITGSFRQAILSLIILFVIGLGVLIFVDPDEAAREAVAMTAR
jgi:UMF1 family MFS transporter